MNPRDRLLRDLAARLDARPAHPVLRVAVDGVDGAGKTTFADELAAAVHEWGRTVIRASVDGFHAPRDVRYRWGHSSSEGFYRDSYAYAGLRTALLDLLGPGGSLSYRTAIFDHAIDSPVDMPELMAESGSGLLLDGLFLHRPELRNVWDNSVFLHVDFGVSVLRGAARGPGYGSSDSKCREQSPLRGGPPTLFPRGRAA